MIHWSSVSWGFVGYPMWQRFRGPWQMRTNRASEDFGDCSEKWYYSGSRIVCGARDA